MENKYPKLIEAIKNNNLVIFVGAGTSINLKNKNNTTLGNWNNLVKRIIIHLNGNSDKFNYLLSLTDHYEPIDVLNLIEKSKDIDKKDIHRFVKDYFELHNENNYDLHKKIFKLSNKIITTNYDPAFEESIPELKYKIAYKGKNFELTTLKDDNPLLFKLHGCFSDVGSMVLFPSNYYDLYKNNNRDAEHTLAVLRNLIFNKTILFIGCGMGDFQINHIFREINEMQQGYGDTHFIISKNQLDSSLSFLTHIPIKEHPEISNILDELIKIKEENIREKEKANIELKEQINELKVALKSSKSKNNILIKELFKEALDFKKSNEFEKAIIKYKQISRIKEIDVVYNNWGNAIYELAKQKNDDSLYEESFTKYKKATELNPKYDKAFYNWGLATAKLAKLKSDELLFEQSFDKYRIATDINPNYDNAFKNWGTALYNYARLKKDEVLYNKSFEKYQKAIDLNSSNFSAIFNLGVSLLSFAKFKKSEKHLKECIEKFSLLIELDPENYSAFNKLGTAFYELSILKNDDSFIEKSIESLLKAAELNCNYFNQACLFVLKGDKTKALEMLEISLREKEIEADYVKEDTVWKAFGEDADFLALIEKYSTKNNHPPLANSKINTNFTA